MRAALTNSGFAIPEGRLSVVCDGRDTGEGGLDLALALAVLLCDPAVAVLRRRWWIAWGGLALDGSAVPTDGPLIKDLPSEPCAGRIWDLDRSLPCEDLVVSIVDVASLLQAWDVLMFFVRHEQAILRG